MLCIHFGWCFCVEAIKTSLLLNVLYECSVLPTYKMRIMYSWARYREITATLLFNRSETLNFMLSIYSSAPIQANFGIFPLFI